MKRPAQWAGEGQRATFPPGAAEHRWPDGVSEHAWTTKGLQARVAPDIRMRPSVFARLCNALDGVTMIPATENDFNEMSCRLTREEVVLQSRRKSRSRGGAIESLSRCIAAWVRMDTENEDPRDELGSKLRFYSKLLLEPTAPNTESRRESSSMVLRFMQNRFRNVVSRTVLDNILDEEMPWNGLGSTDREDCSRFLETCFDEIHEEYTVVHAALSRRPHNQLR